MRDDGPFAAELLAKYGRKLTYEEAFLRLYYEAKDEWDYAVMTGKRILYPWRIESQIKLDEEFKQLKEKFESCEQTISQMFMQAVNSHDGERIKNLAKAVSFLKDKRHLPQFAPVDRERTLLLFLKALLDHSGEKIPIRLVAQWLLLDNPEARKKFNTPADGFSALRRKCIQLGIPLAESRKRGRK